MKSIFFIYATNCGFSDGKEKNIPVKNFLNRKYSNSWSRKWNFSFKDYLFIGNKGNISFMGFLK